MCEVPCVLLYPILFHLLIPVSCDHDSWKAKSQKKNSNAFCFRLKMIHFRTFSKLALGLINRKTSCHEAIMKVQPHWFNAKCDKRIREVGGANATSRQNNCASFDRLILERKFRSILSTK